LTKNVKSNNKTTTLHPFNGLLFQDNLSKPAPERTILDFNEARDDGVAVASAGPYANLHMTQK